MLRAFLAEQRDDGLAGLGRDAVIHAAEVPNVDYRLPRQLEPGIFDQFINPANLARLASEQHRTIVLVLATTGLRVSIEVDPAVVAATRDAPPDPYAQDLAQAPAGGAALLAEEVRSDIATRADELRELLDSD